MLLFSVDPNKTAIERAFELAKSGRAGSVDEIRRSLTSEGYSTHHLTGATLLAQLRTSFETREEKPTNLECGFSLFRQV